MVLANPKDPIFRMLNDLRYGYNRSSGLVFDRPVHRDGYERDNITRRNRMILCQGGAETSL
jgi:hypothetical protein